MTNVFGISNRLFVIAKGVMIAAVGSLFAIVTGTVTFPRLKGSVSMPARAVSWVQGVKVADDDGIVSWHMRVVSDSGAFTVDFFSRVAEFMGDMRTLSPGLQMDRWMASGPVSTRDIPNWAASSGRNERYCLHTGSVHSAGFAQARADPVLRQGKVP